jgi:hypothetical protein
LIEKKTRLKVYNVDLEASKVALVIDFERKEHVPLFKQHLEFIKLIEIVEKHDLRS